MYKSRRVFRVTTYVDMVGTTRDLLLMCSINPSKHYMIQFLERSSNGAIGNTVLVEIEIHSMMI